MSVAAHDQGVMDDTIFRLKGMRAFIAAPMSGFDSDSSYDESRRGILQLVEHLKQSSQCEDVYYAGQDIPSQSDFSGSNLALDLDINALRSADVFIMIYPTKVVSSVLLEAGYAMALGKPMLIFAKDRRDLPYLLREAAELEGKKGIPPVEIHEYRDSSDLQRNLTTALKRVAKP